MTQSHFYKLNNPAWYSLIETHRHFALGNDEIKRYRKDIVSFAAIHSPEKEILLQLDNWMDTGETFFLIGEIPALPANYNIENSLPCAQMVCTREIKTEQANEMEALGENNSDEMVELINQTLPGYYLPDTRLMGDYFGIRINGELVAMTGERMRMNGLTEISAVVTHPEFTGRGYAQQLVAHVSNKNLAAGIIAFLHTAATNERAIKIYEHLGYTHRRVIDFHKIKRER